VRVEWHGYWGIGNCLGGAAKRETCSAPTLPCRWQRPCRISQLIRESPPPPPHIHPSKPHLFAPDHHKHPDSYSYPQHSYPIQLSEAHPIPLFPCTPPISIAKINSHLFKAAPCAISNTIYRRTSISGTIFSGKKHLSGTIFHAI
jgi:hypothetical protein